MWWAYTWGSLYSGELIFGGAYIRGGAYSRGFTYTPPPNYQLSLVMALAKNTGSLLTQTPGFEHMKIRPESNKVN